LVFSIFENFQYSDVVAGPAESHALVFRADVGSVPLHGVDYLRMTPEGRVAEFHVMVRPLGALTALGRAVTERMRGAGRPPQ